MKGRKKILLLALFAVATLVFSACSKTQTNNDFSVGGIVITDADFFEISILVNGIKTDYSLDSSGYFNISHLKSGDVITFSKEGYSFNSYTVGGFSVDGIEIVGTKCRYDVLTFFDENYGTVTGAGKYEYGETATLSLTPKEHFEINGIYEKDNLVSSTGEYSFAVTDDRVFVVKFSKKKYPITIEKTDEACVVEAPENAAFGAHNVLVKVKGDGFGENESAININYVRPYDTPKNVGMLIEEGKVYFVFQQVLAASGYEIFMNGQKVETPPDKKSSGESILVRVDTLFTENGTYAFSVRATGDRPESDMSDASEYTFKGTLSAPVAKIENGVLTVSHEKDVKFLVEINGVNVADKLDENKSLALSDVLEKGTTTAKIKITAMLDGYKPSSAEIIYNAEE